MATKPGTACRHPGCPELTRDPSGYCQAHRKQSWRRYSAEHEARRPSARQRGYDKDWERFRAWFLQRNPLCARCRERGRITTAEVVHHIQSIRERPDLRLDPENCMALCRDCHEKIHGRRRKTERRSVLQ